MFNVCEAHLSLKFSGFSEKVAIWMYGIMISREDTEAVVGSLVLLLHHPLLPPSNGIVFRGEFVKILFLCRDLLFSDKNTSHLWFHILWFLTMYLKQCNLHIRIIILCVYASCEMSVILVKAALPQILSLPNAVSTCPDTNWCFRCSHASQTTWSIWD